MKEQLTRMRAMDEDITRLAHITALLEWDQETYLPDGGVPGRSKQIALMVGLHHDKVVDQEWERLFSELHYDGEKSPENMSEVETAFLREAWKRWVKKTRVPKSLVENLARETSLSQAAWAKARANDDFDSFAPHLETVITLQREYAAAIGPDKDPYDVLLDEYEPGATGAEIAKTFDHLAQGLGEVLDAIRSVDQVEDGFLKQAYTVKRQDVFGRRVQEFLGYDFSRGRLDLSAHPFTTTLGSDDVRVTTRYDEHLVLSGLFSNIHEAGHGLYEQGMGDDLRGTLLADGTSLGIHESQSRFWENIVGRSPAFWERWYPVIVEHFPENLAGISQDQFVKAVNKVEPSLIRVEADEVTYSFHVIARFRLEQALISGDLAVSDLPEAWNAAYRDLLGIAPPSNADGCLQDVHWSFGLFGYFPTYALGNLYAAQFTKKMEEDLGPLGPMVSSGDAKPILEWLRANIHIHGRVYPPDELCRRVTGASLEPQYFLDYLWDKYAGIYGFSRK